MRVFLPSSDPLDARQKRGVLNTDIGQGDDLSVLGPTLAITTTKRPEDLGRSGRVVEVGMADDLDLLVKTRHARSSTPCRALLDSATPSS